MNVATRTLAQGIAVSHSKTRAITLTTPIMGLTSLIAVLLISAFSVIYISDLNRQAFNELSSLQHSRNHLYTQWGQLLLEENTWAAPERIENVAKQDLGMIIPNAKNVVIIGS